MNPSKEAFMKLQNGSDIRGIAVKTDDGPPVTLTESIVNSIAQGFVRWLSEKAGLPAEDLRVGVGHDSRITASQFQAQALKGITGSGAFAVDCGLASTPSMFMSVQFAETSYQGAIMLTASHLPFTHNGLKFFDRDGGLEKADITRILELASELEPVEGDKGRVEKRDLLTLYAASLRETICREVGAEDYQKPLAGLHVVVDAGNGVGGFFVDKVLAPLGADTEGSQFLEPDGMFPNHVPNPENKAAMEAVRQATLNNTADMGIIFDTDVDRMSAVLSDGSEVNRDAIIAMMAAIIAPDNPGGTIVTDSVTSHRLTWFLEEELKLRHHRFRRGYKNVINEAKRLNAQGISSPLAIETSGHGALKENYFLDDGAYMAVKLLAAAAKAAREGRTIDALIEKLPPLCEDREYRLHIFEDNFQAYGKRVLEQFEARAAQAGYKVEPDSHEGVRLSFDSEQVQGWTLLRMSLHDPLMPLNLEGNRPGDCDKILDILKDLLEDFDQLELGILI